MTLFAVYLATIGLATGSFLALVADRVPRDESIVGERSHCDACGRRLAWWELVPVLSYAGLRGRCAGCRARIPARLPVIELTTGALFVLAGLRFGATPAAAAVMAYASLLIVISLVDLDHRLILNKLVFPGWLAAVALAPLTPWAGGSVLAAWGLSLAGAAIGFGLLLGVYLLSRGGMGAGDVKLAGLIGAMVGFPGVIAALFVGFVAGGIVGVLLLVLRLRGRKDVIPYGPYLAAGAVTALLYGEPLLDWYLRLLGVAA